MLSPVLCCCSAKVAVIFVSLLDMLIGLGTTILCLIPFYDLMFMDETSKQLDQDQAMNEIFWYGLTTIGTMGLASIWSAISQLRWIQKGSKVQKRPISYAVKLILCFIIEVVGFVLPFYIFPDYAKHIDTIRSLNPNPFRFWIFCLLKVNFISGTLFVYQVYSSWVILHYINSVICTRHEVLEAVIVTPKPIVPRKHKRRAPSRPDPNVIELRKLPAIQPTLKSKSRDATVLESNFDSNKSNVSTDSGRRCGNAVKTKAPAPKGEFQRLRAQCLSKQTLYKDPDFPPIPASFMKNIQWIRPQEISENAQFFANGVSRFDVKQGQIGDCYFLAAVANLTLHDERFAKVVPKENCWENGFPYAGICYFRFFVSGSWKEVIIDDRLPTRDRKLIFLTSCDEDEFWSSLLEKAYAKLHGGYHILDRGGHAGEAMKELTGGSVEQIRVFPYRHTVKFLFHYMEQALRAGNLVACSINERNNESLKGLAGGHAYSVSDVKRVTVEGRGTVGLIRIRNPWGDETEWTGDWSDRNPLWDLVDKPMKNALKLQFVDDGEFWFPIKEFAEYFDLLEICYLSD